MLNKRGSSPRLTGSKSPRDIIQNTSNVVKQTSVESTGSLNKDKKSSSDLSQKLHLSRSKSLIGTRKMKK